MAVTLNPADVRDQSSYALLEERILARDQRGAADVLYSLQREGRSVTELLYQAVRIHAPYTHVPFHQRLDNGLVKFVNNDHCLLSARATVRLTQLMPKGFETLPLAQTVWYLPTGLDPWNQLLGKAPGHYTRLYKISVDEAPPPPQIHWPDAAPLGNGSAALDEEAFQAGLDGWLTLVQQ